MIPAGLLAAMSGRAESTPTASVDTQASAARARAVVMEIEGSLGFEPTDREFEKLGYDIESGIPGTGKLRFVEVKGRVTGASTITVTRNEILYSLNKPALITNVRSSSVTQPIGGETPSIAGGGPTRSLTSSPLAHAVVLGFCIVSAGNPGITEPFASSRLAVSQVSASSPA